MTLPYALTDIAGREFREGDRINLGQIGARTVETVAIVNDPNPDNDTLGAVFICAKGGLRQLSEVEVGAAINLTANGDERSAVVAPA